MVKEAADKGHISAKSNLAWIYSNIDDYIDYQKAALYYEQMANNGDSNAQVFLGHCGLGDYGFSVNYDNAYKWYKMAAESGNAEAQNMLGRCYEEGWGISKDISKAKKYYKLAAKQDFADAQRNIGVLLWNEYNDETEARKWLQKAADNGSSDANKLLEELENTLIEQERQRNANQSSYSSLSNSDSSDDGMAGAAIGAAIGGFVGGPVGFFVGGWLGSKIGKK